MADKTPTALHFPNSRALCEYISNQTGGVTLLSFSGGKDSVGAWLQLREFFPRIIPFYLYHHPDLEFIEDNLRYYEDFFGVHIYRMPHPAIYKYFNAAIFQAPERLQIIEDRQLIEYGSDDVADMIKLREGIPFRSCYTALGVRAVDSLNRWSSIKKHGAVNQNRMNFYPIYDWRKDDLLSAIIKAGVKLSAEYRVFGRTFDGLDWRFMKPMKDTWPRDYARMVEMFPMIEAELLRYEVKQQLFD